MTEVNQTENQVISISDELALRIQEELGENVYLCYQCVKCSSGCPVSEFFDWQPNQILRALQLGQEDIALESTTPWLCASCQTCTTRCPQGIDIAAIMDFLTRESLSMGIKSPIPEVKIFNEAFMREVNLWGRAFELGLMAEMKLRTKDIFGDMDLAVKMLQKQKLAFLPAPTRVPRKVKPIPGAEKAIAYYPGCSLDTIATEFNISSKKVCEALDMELIEPKGWICCGSSAAHKVDPEKAYQLPMENLVLIEQSGFKEVTMPCAACFSRHKFAQQEYRHLQSESNGSSKKEISEGYHDEVTVNTLLTTIYNHIGPEKLREKTNNSLNNFPVVSYYGCLLTRPPEVTEAPNPENPVEMDELMDAIGANALDWSYKTSCCGAAHSLTRKDIVHKLSGGLIQHARETGAEAIVVACPLCHMNLDARQIQMEVEKPMPILYFTQLIAIALGLPEKSAMLNKNIVDPRPLLRKWELIT